MLKVLLLKMVIKKEEKKLVHKYNVMTKKIYCNSKYNYPRSQYWDSVTCVDCKIAFKKYKRDMRRKSYDNLINDKVRYREFLDKQKLKRENKSSKWEEEKKKYYQLLENIKKK